MSTEQPLERRRQGPKPEEMLWDSRDVARYLKVSRSWVYYRAETGQLPCVFIGGLVRFKPDVIRAWAEGAKAKVGAHG